MQPRCPRVFHQTFPKRDHRRQRAQFSTCPVRSSSTATGSTYLMQIPTTIPYRRIHRISTTLSRKYGIQTYLCASRTQYTWLPPAPGKHGFLQYDLGLKKDQDPAQEPDGLNTANTVATPPIDTEMECHVFVGTGTGSPEVFHYCGFYRIIRADDLTKEEWEGLPSEVCKPDPTSCGPA